MKPVAKLLLIAVAISLDAMAQPGEAAKDAVLDTGPGGFTLTVSLPNADGPLDFAHNIGPKITTDNGAVYGEVAYVANASHTAVVDYKVAVYRDDQANERNKPITAEAIAREMLRNEGFAGKATSFQCPFVPIEGATIACYKTKGTPVVGEQLQKLRKATTVASVSFANNTQAYVFVGNATEMDGKKFDADSTETERISNRAVGLLWLKSSLKIQ